VALTTTPGTGASTATQAISSSAAAPAIAQRVFVTEPAGISVS
jgi:broad-specificity NMP kinase